MIYGPNGENLENLAELIFSQYVSAPADMVCNPLEHPVVKQLLEKDPAKLEEIASRYNYNGVLAGVQKELSGSRVALNLDPNMAMLAYGDRRTRYLDAYFIQLSYENTALKNIIGDLLDYKKLVPGTFQHVDQLTIERRTNTDLRQKHLYTADGNLYTVQGKKCLWAITREPQNLVLQHIDEAYRQLTNKKNYFPDADEAKSSLEHPFTVVVELEGLNLGQDNNEYSYFVVDPKKLNSQQRIAAQRIYGPDKYNFEENMKMFERDRITPRIYVLTPDYVQETLKRNGKKFLGRALWLYDFNDYSNFLANFRLVNFHSALRGGYAVQKKSGMKK